MRTFLRTHALPCALLCLGAALVYGKSYDYHFVNWDDPHHVYANKALLQPEEATWQDRWLGRNIGYPLPLTLATWRIDHLVAQALSRDAPTMARGAVFHRTQLALLMALCLSLYALMLTVTPDSKTGRALAALSAALALSHPTFAEPLCWITGRKDLLCLIFVALCVRELWQAAEEEHRGWWRVGVFATMAIASKPTAIFLAPLALYGWWSRRKAARLSWSLGLGVVAWLTAVAALVVWIGSEWHQDVGGVAELDSLSARVQHVCATAGRHLAMIVAPVDLRAKYVLSSSAPLSIWAWAATALVPVALWLAWTRRQSATGWAAVWMLVAWIPVSNIVPLRREVADSYVVVHWTACAWWVCALLSQLAQRNDRLTHTATAVVTAMTLTLASVASTQAATWRDSTTLWARVLRFEQRSPQVCRMAGHGLFVEGERLEALKVWETCAQRFDPNLFANNLAQVYAQIGRREDALRWVQFRLRHAPEDARALRLRRRLEVPPRSHRPSSE